MASRSSLIVNARVHLPGSKGRAGVVSNNIEYIATRPGADRSATLEDLRKAELSERMALAGYYSERPGSTALFDADGAVPLKEARRRLTEADGALATLVVSVRREEAGELALGCKAEWERWARANLQPALAEAMGVPESSVRWVAAEHENAEASKHIHVIAWSSDGSFDSLMVRNRLERARGDLVDAALAPALAREHLRRDSARDAAVAAARAVPADLIQVDLPGGGRISYAHLRRYHSETAARLDEALEAARARDPALAAAEREFSEAVSRSAELKGLEGDGRAAYERAAAADLRSREVNALLRSKAPDRSTAHRPARGVRPSPAPGDGPAIRRARRSRLEAEVRACVPPGERERAREAVASGGPVPAEALGRCPSMSAATRRAPAAVARAVGRALAAPVPQRRGRADLADEVARQTDRTLARALEAAILAAARGDLKGVAADAARELAKGMFL